MFLKKSQTDVTLRVAGGWVRDKLLGHESTDIDIALDKCSGEYFAEKFHNYLIENSYESHGFGVIRKNPDKSKHLETATIQLFNSWIDFVNLRGEEYGEDSRIPTVTIGTPESDAFRRDLTINALFYNINEDKIEDFTKMGIEDLKNGIIRTPLEPSKTFSDDPLRILRCFRFAVRFNFKIDPLILQAVKINQIKEAFAKKISRERIGIEFMSNFEKNPSLLRSFDFFNLIHDSGLWPVIMNTTQTELIEIGQRSLMHCVQRIDPLRSQIEQTCYEMAEKDQSKSFKVFEFYFCSMIAVFTLQWFDQKLKDYKKLFLYGFMLNSIKLPHRLAEFSCHFQKSLAQISNLQKSFDGDITDYAMWVRETGPCWKIVHKCYEYLLELDSQSNPPSFDITRILEDKGLSAFYNTKPLFDGKELSQLFGVVGAQIRVKQIEMLRFQVMYPNSSREDYIKKCKQ